MRLDEVFIGEFKNLRDLRVDFDETSPYTVFVGENGAGKSNLIEALTLIFRNLDLDLPAPFVYRLKYRCRGHDVEIRIWNVRHCSIRLASKIQTSLLLTSTVLWRSHLHMKTMQTH